MSGLKELRSRIKSVKQTQKITSAMKMVSAAKLKKAQDQLHKARGYLNAYHLLLNALWLQRSEAQEIPLLMKGHTVHTDHLIVVATADRGLCGSFNASLIREARITAQRLMHKGEKVTFLVLGRKGTETLKKEFPNCMLPEEFLNDLSKGSVKEQAQKVSLLIQKLFKEGRVTRVSGIYSVFKSALVQKVVLKDLLPLTKPELEQDLRQGGLYDFEPSFDHLLENGSNDVFNSLIYEIFLEKMASEQGARMTAMDNATRNSKDMIKKLEVTYNRTRQAAITKELIEIISGAQAV
jgi:F-type H+-transporting ATPase subunit gamma